MPEQRQHHPTLSPSKLDILRICPFFQAGEAGEAAQAGSNQHAYAEILLHKEEKNTGVANLSPEDKDNVQWYVDYVNCNASGKLEIEQRLELWNNGEVVTFGTIDAGAGPDIFDYKSDREERPHNYQMAAYALMWMQKHGLEQATAHICYGRLRKAVKLTFTKQEAQDMIELVMAIYYNPERKQTPSEYCAWCKLAAECPALNRGASMVVQNVSTDMQVFTWNPDQVSDPAMLGKMLSFARIITAWSEAIEKKSKSIIEQGGEIPGWSVLQRSGGREIKNIIRAYELCGISQDAFLQACKVGIGQLEEIYAKERSITKKEAKQTLKDLLAEVSEDKKPVTLLVKNKGE